MIRKIFGRKSVGNRPARRQSNQMFRLGDRVLATTGDQGLVTGFHPDGTIIVSLGSGGKCEAIFPSFLRRIDD